jgi:predicted aldo/keto reductase-like oxidoreductase
MDSPQDGSNRREFLRRGVATVGACGIGLAGAPVLAETEEPRVRRYRKLGRTGLEISDISMGTSRNSDPRVVRHAFDRGINYFDTAETYRDGESEKAVGTALQGLRDKVFLATKTNASPEMGRRRLMDRLERSLKRLQTDHVDVYFNHAVNAVERLQNDEWFEFVAQAKKEGKLRFSGMSGHGGRLVECLDYALDRDLVDVILVAYNFGQDPAFYERFTRNFDFVAHQTDLPRVLAKAREKNVGVIAMKTLMGARLNDMKPYEWEGSTFAQAAFRWVLSDPKVDALVVSMNGPKMVDVFLGGSGKSAVRKNDSALMRRYFDRNGPSYCRPACDACTGSCPDAVPIADVLRARMYAVDYGDLELARSGYAQLGRGAEACADCASPTCLSSCPYGLDIPELTRSTLGILGS